MSSQPVQGDPEEYRGAADGTTLDGDAVPSPGPVDAPAAALRPEVPRLTEPTPVRRRMHDPAPDFPAFVRKFLADKGREVVMVVRDRRGHVWLHRKGHWRLPTGNLRPGEDPTRGVAREVEEEFGASLPLVRPLGVLELEPDIPDPPAGARPFVAHFFLLHGGEHTPGPVPAEGIDAWCAVPVAELRSYADRLRALRPNAEPNGWMRPYWGAFRALELEVAADLLLVAGQPVAE